ncbi:uncharacterized protein [Centruroides vittatus]|uniref:uncharacterized protein n=1 Tax=Centruroides vittatus TaxID=120091 RepID=UPI00350FE47C
MEEEKIPTRRRSSFIRGRLSIKSELSTSDICLNVPLTLSAEERFLKLLQLCYMKAAEEVSKDLYPDDGKESQRFLMDANEGFAKTEQLLKERKLCQLTSDNDNDMLKTIQNKDVEVYEEYMKRLSEESDAWEKIITEAKEKLCNMQNSADEQQQIIIKPDESSKSEYDSMINDISHIKEELNLELHSLPKVNLLLDNVTKKAEDSVIHQNYILESMMFEEIKDSPHRLMKNAVETK